MLIIFLQSKAFVVPEILVFDVLIFEVFSKKEKSEIK